MKSEMISDHMIDKNFEITDGVIIKYKGESKNVVIPETFTALNGNKYKVTSIGEEAFSDCESLTSITIPNSVTSIGNLAFAECSSLKSITIPECVTSIGDGAFLGCISLKSITISNSVTSIGAFTFERCSSLKSITIPDSVTSIGIYAIPRKNTTIHGKVGSIAEEYAKKYNIKFIAE